MSFEWVQTLSNKCCWGPGVQWGLSKSERANYWRKSNLSKLYSLSTSTLQSDFQGINSRSRVYARLISKTLLSSADAPDSSRNLAPHERLRDEERASGYSGNYYMQSRFWVCGYNLLSRWNNFAPINNSTVCGAKKIDTNSIGVSRCLSSYPFVQQHYWCLMVRKYDL